MEAFGIILLLAAMAFVLSAAHSLVSQWLDQDDKSQDRKK